jgi:hypothetical protein
MLLLNSQATFNFERVHPVVFILTISLLMLYIYIYIYGRDILLGILLLEPCILLIYALKTNQYTNYSFSLLIIYGSSYMFRHYIFILRERS